MLRVVQLPGYEEIETLLPISLSHIPLSSWLKVVRVRSVGSFRNPYPIRNQIPNHTVSVKMLYRTARRRIEPHCVA